MRKKVCIDINSIVRLHHQGYLSGVGRTTLELVRAIDRISDSLPLDIVLYTQNTKMVSAKTFNIGLPFVHFPLPHRKWMRRFASYLSIRELIIKHSLFHCPHNDDFVDDISSTIFTIHDLVVLNCEDEFSEWEVKRVRNKFPVLLDRAKAIITCSHSSKADLIASFEVDPSKIHVVYWGINHELFRVIDNYRAVLDKYKLNSPYFFSVSCGYGRKNTLNLIQAYICLLEDKNPINDLVIVWNNPNEYVWRLIKQAEGRIHLLNKLSDEELVCLYNGASVTFYPSKYEGFGLPLLESIACGTPVVTCNNSSLAEIGKDYVIYTGETVNDICQTMDDIECRRYDLTGYIGRGMDYVKSFTWEKCARETLAIYEKYS